MPTRAVPLEEQSEEYSMPPLGVEVAFRRSETAQQKKSAAIEVNETISSRSDESAP